MSGTAPPSVTESSRYRNINTSSAPGLPSTSYKYRAGVPALPMLPLRAVPVDANLLISRVIQPLLTPINYVLQQTSGIKGFTVELVHRISPSDRFSLSANNIFVLVRSTWNKDSENSWLNTAIRIKDMLVNCGITFVGVEIIAPELWRRKYMTIVEWDSPFVAAWNNIIHQHILQTLLESSEIANNICAVNILRLGFHTPAEKNPITILVTVDWSMNPAGWADIQATLEKIIRDYQELPAFAAIAKTKTIIHFENGENALFAEEPQVDTERFDKGWITADPSYEIQPGASLGGKNPQIDDDGESCLGGIGTVGPILKFTEAGEQKGVFALTSYHVARYLIPGMIIPSKAVRDDPMMESKCIAKEGSLLYNLDRSRSGFGPTWPDWLPKDLEVFRSPALKVVDDTLKQSEFALQEEKKTLDVYTAEQDPDEHAIPLTQAKIDSLISDVNLLKRFQQSNDTVFGAAYISSGPNCRTSGNTELDYMLIEIDKNVLASRQVNNRLPTIKAFSNEFSDMVPAALNGGRLRGIQVLSHDFSSIVCKIGAKTKGTIGLLNPMKSSVFSRKHGDSVKSITTEFCVVGGLAKIASSSNNTSKFADHGDSGAAVWDRCGRWVGVVRGGTTVQQTTRILGANIPEYVTYITSAEDIIKHIKQSLLNMGKAYEVELY